MQRWLVLVYKISAEQMSCHAKRTRTNLTVSYLFAAKNLSIVILAERFGDSSSVSIFLPAFLNDYAAAVTSLAVELNVCVL